MEKAKEIIHCNLENIETQLNVLTNLLQKIVKLNANNSDVVNNLSPSEVIHSTSLLQHVNSVQSVTLEKLNSIIIDLEFFYEQNIGDTSKCDTQHAVKTAKILQTEIHKELVENVHHRNASDDTKQSAETCQKDDAHATNSGTIIDKLKNTKLWRNMNDKDTNLILDVMHFKPSGKHLSTTEESDIISSVYDISNPERKTSSIYMCNELKEKPVPKVNSKCLISHMESPSEFYIQMIDNENTTCVDTISDIIFEMYENKAFDVGTKEQTADEFGRYCVAFIEKYEAWYRVEVIDWLPSEEVIDDVIVRLVDHGPKCQIPYQLLRPMCEQVAYYPKVAQLCHLPHLYPPGYESNRSFQWPRASIEGFYSLLDMKAPYIVTYAKKDGDSIAIDLIKDQEEESIGELLMKLGLAEAPQCAEIVQNDGIFINEVMKNQILGAHGIAAVPDMTNDEKVKRYLDSYDSEEKADNINEAIGAYDPKDESRICRLTRHDGGKCFKANCQFEHAKITEDFTTDKVIAYKKAIEDLVLPQTGEEIVIRITYVTTACKFFAQIISSVSDHTAFLDLQSCMNQSQTVKRYKPFKVLPARGEIAVFKSWNGGQWCRAQVRDIMDHENETAIDVQVFAVDYGELVDTKLTALRQISEDFLSVPFQAVECRLFNAKENETVPDSEAKDFFEHRYLCKDFNATVMANVSYLELLVKDENGKDIGESLIEKGFAIEKTEHIFPTENELILVD